MGQNDSKNPGKKFPRPSLWAVMTQVIPIYYIYYLGIMPDFFLTQKRTRGFRYFPLRKNRLFDRFLMILITFFIKIDEN